MTNLTLGEKIKQIRKGLGLNQTDFAKELGFKFPTAVSKFEDNTRTPDKNKLIKIAELGKISLDELLTGEGSMNKNDRTIEEAPIIKKEVMVAPAQETPSAIPNFSIADDLMLAAKVLESRTHYATALHLNIRSFAGAVDDSMQLNGIVSRVEKLAKNFEELKAENDDLKKKINKLAGRHGGCPPTALGMEHAARTGTDD
jgi:transcriptional regulator with XRE-family HTH domain